MNEQKPLALDILKPITKQYTDYQNIDDIQTHGGFGINLMALIL